MRNPKKTLVYNKIDSLVSNNPYLVVAQYSHKYTNTLQELKKISQIYVPKNSICKLYIEEKFGKEIPTLNIFEGPTFILGLKNVQDIAKASSIIEKSKIKVYGGIFNETFLYFADLGAFMKLVTDPNIVEKTYFSLNYSRKINQSLVSIIPKYYHFIFKMTKLDK